MNCGADIVAITAWMSTEMASLKSLVQKTNVIPGNNDDRTRLAEGYN